MVGAARTLVGRHSVAVAARGLASLAVQSVDGRDAILLVRSRFRLMRGLLVRACALGVVPAVALGLVGAAPAAANHDRPSPGAASVNDRLFPGLGNGGYNVSHYALDFTYPTTATEQEIPAVATIRARATQSLSRFNLDFRGDSLGGVSVDGRPAVAVWRGEEIEVTPRFPIDDGHRFVVKVSYTSGPREVDPDADLNTVLAAAWFASPSGSLTAAQPSFAHRIFPSNDHPSDLATYTIKADTPAQSTFVANGELADSSTRDGRTKWTYVEREPMASELIQLAFGALTVRYRGVHDGVALRDVAPTAQIDALEPALLRAPDHLDWMTNLVGRYPFRTYGSFLSDATFPFALEDQTISLYPAFLFLPPFPPAVYEPIMVHELAHQWFGDSVPPARWSDVWLNEGHATWYEWSYGAQFFGRDFEGSVRAAYSQGDTWRDQYGPVALPKYGADDIAKMFSPNIYDGGATVLFALRQVIGDDAFRLLERAWAQLPAGHPVTTQDFIRLASIIAHRDLRPFLNDWLYGTKTPPMPGHPDWTVDSVGAPTSQALRASGGSLEALSKR
jgi:aminopeptidase N